MKRIPPSVRLSLLAEELRRNNNVDDLAGELFRLGGQKILQELVEAETTERLGRKPYERRPDAPSGYRNGYKTRKVRTAEGVVEVDVPQVRDTEEPFRLALWEALRKRTDVLDRLAVVIPRFRAEKECLKLVFATLWRSSERWRRVRSSEHERRQFERYRQERAARQTAQRDGKTAIVA